jgi:rRNA maturation endonuclease Nob1
MRLPVYVISYRCRRCGSGYSAEWDPNRPGHVEPASVCPSCGSPVRLYLGMGQKSEGAASSTGSAVAGRGAA